MNIRSFIIKAIGAVSLALLSVSPAFAAAAVSISHAGDRSYEVRGAGIEAAAGFEMTIRYDPATLSNPRVAQGGLAAGALMAVNATVPGSIRMAMVRTVPVTGSGVLATIAFDSPGGLSGRIISLSAKLADAAGKAIPVLAQVNDPAAGTDTALSNEPPSPQEGYYQNNPAPAQPPSAPGPAATVPSGVIIVPQTPAAPPPLDEDREPEAVRRPPDKPAVTAKMTASPVPPVPEPSSRKIQSYKSVLERFREFRGKPSVQAYLALFEQNEVIGFRQEPPVGLADGRTKVRVSFISVPGDRRASDVALMGGRLVAMEKDPEYTNTWIAAVEPAKNEYAASLTVFLDKYLIVYPLTIAPAADIDLNGSGTVTEDDFALFLRERGTPQQPKFDLNRDGKRDSVDDYIFSANYVVSLRHLPQPLRGNVPAASRSSRSNPSAARTAPRN